MLKKLFLIIIKYMPIIQMIGMLINNTIYYLEDTYRVSYIIDFAIGNSIIFTILLYVSSYMFGFCKYYRMIITANLLNLLLANLDSIYKLPISDIELLISYYIISSIGIMTITYFHITKKIK